jgi:hypothetical protein
VCPATVVMIEEAVIVEVGSNIVVAAGLTMDAAIIVVMLRPGAVTVKVDTIFDTLVIGAALLDPPAEGVIVKTTVDPATNVVLEGLADVTPASVTYDTFAVERPSTPTPPYGRVVDPDKNEVALPTSTSVGVTQLVMANVQTGVAVTVVVVVDAFGVIVTETVLIETELFEAQEEDEEAKKKEETAETTDMTVVGETVDVVCKTDDVEAG